MGPIRIFGGDFSFSTDEVAARDRTSYWQEYVSQSLIGIECTATNAAGLNVALSCSQLGEIGIAELNGNSHVVERNSQRIRSHQKDSAFVCLQLKGSTHILQGGECMPVEAGDIFYYATSSPYVHGNTTDIHTLIFDVPLNTMISRCAGFKTERPGKLGQNLGYGHLALAGVLDIAARLRNDASPRSKAEAGNRLLSLLTSLLGSSRHGSCATRSQMYVVLQAKGVD